MSKFDELKFKNKKITQNVQIRSLKFKNKEIRHKMFKFGHLKLKKNNKVKNVQLWPSKI